MREALETMNAGQVEAMSHDIGGTEALRGKDITSSSEDGHRTSSWLGCQHGLAGLRGNATVPGP
jgi:hypothetical protein